MIELIDFDIEHYDAVYALWEAADGVGVDESDSRESIERYLQRNAGLSLVAFADEQLIAAALCGHDGRRGYLSHVAVADSHRGQGLGRQIVEACLTRLQAQGINGCNIRLLENNHDGRHFWERVGFWKHNVEVWTKRPAKDA